jgi:putative heme iron utilization protein
MDIIIPNLKRYSDGEIDRAFMQEIKSGFKLEQKTEKARVDQAAKEAQQLKGTIHPTLGRPIATIPPREYFRLVQKYGQETVHSKEFLKYYQKKFPQLSPNKI